MKWVLFLAALLTCGHADAQDRAATLMDPPAWVLKPTPAIDCNFALGAYYNCPLDKTFSVTRASTKYCQWQSQIWMSVASGAPCITDQGWLIEEARTNIALWARDMTQSGTWVAVTMTAALNAVGIDGTANSATTLTSTSAAGTILQSLTASSTAYTYTVFVKGVTVTGAIQIADYPVLTPAFTTLTSSNCFNPVTGVGTAPASGQAIFLRCTITATSLNPVIGFKFANSGDSIIVDFNQLEAAAFGTSPILTTSASATRAADVVATNSSNLLDLIAQGTFTIFMQTNVLNNTANFGYLWWFSANNKTFVGNGNTTLTIRGTSADATVTVGSGGWTTLVRTAAYYDTANHGGVANSGTVVNNANPLSGLPLTTVVWGSNNGANFADGNIQRLTVWPWRVPSAQLQMLTSPN